MIRAFSTLIFCLLISPLAFSDEELLRSTTQPATTQPTARSTTAKISLSAQKALPEIDAAYSKLKTLKLSGTISFEQDVAGQQRKFTAPFTASCALPNKFRHEAKDNILAGSTGEIAYALSLEDNAYVQKDAPPDGRTEDAWPRAVWSVVSTEDPSLAMALSPKASTQLVDCATEIAHSLVRGSSASDIEKASEVTLVVETRLGDISDLTIHLTNPAGEFKFVFDLKTHLLRKLLVDERKAFEKVGQPDVKKAMLTFDYEKTEAGIPLDDKQFAWTPPINARELTAAVAEGQEGSALIDKPAPSFKLTLLDGKSQVSLSQFKGKVVVIDFWAVWCPHCVDEMPSLNQFAEKHKDAGVVVLAVDEDDDKEKVKPFVADHHLTLPVLLDDGHKVSEDYGVNGIPHTVVIGPDGRVKNVFVGYGPGSDEKLAKAVDNATK
jgi:peroxiredoxin